MSVLDADVVVIGAGLAGLSAARSLRQRGQRVVVLEARERVGGRTLSQPIDGVTFDLGGQWIGQNQTRMLGLIKEFGLETHATYASGRQVLELRGKRSTYSGTIPRLAPWTLLRLHLGIRRIERALKTIDVEAPWASKGAGALDAISAEAWMQNKVGHKDAIAVIRSAVRVILGEELANISMLAFLHYCASSGGLMTLVETEGGHQELRIVGGAQQVSERLADHAGELIFEAPVSRIVTESDGVTVHHARGETRACFAIVTLPLTLAGQIDYHPALPLPRVELAKRASMGATVKCVMTYERAFWRAQGFSGAAVSTEGPISVVYDNCGPTGHPCLVAFIVAEPARGWSDTAPTARKARVLTHMTRLMGPDAGAPVSYVEQDWATEPFSAGAPVANFAPGTLSAFGPALRAPIGRLHWAGTESARAFTGFMEGAVESGLRAADEVFKRSP